MGQPTIRDIRCKSILNSCSIGDYSLNCYVGCAHGCIYCYARFMQRFHPHQEYWGNFVDVKVNAVDVLRRQLSRARPGQVFLSSACDGWQPEEASRGLTRACALLLLENGFQLNVLTKSDLILRDLDALAGKPARVSVSLSTLDEPLSRVWEPGASSVRDRLRIIREAQSRELKSGLMFAPLLPLLYDGAEAVRTLLECAGDLGVDFVWFDSLNPRPKVWESVEAHLRREAPELAERYRRILFSSRVRSAYLAGLRERIVQQASQLGLGAKVKAC